MSAALELFHHDLSACRPLPIDTEARPLASVSVLHVPGSAAAAMPFRLTHRGVAVVSFLVAALAVALVWAAAVSAPRTPASVGMTTARAIVTVQAGDTLWAIAARVAPERDPRVEIENLQQLNHLSSVDLEVGQRLRVR